jgi:two-component system, NtrC family, sensor histidine kinase HydH
MNEGTTTEERAASLLAITSIVHDLRNPLSSIHGSAEILLGSRLSEAQIHRIARNMYGASVRMKELLDEFLSRCCGAEQEMEFCNLRELVASAADRMALLAESQSVEIVQRVPGNLVLALDRQRIQRVLINLLANALDVMPNGGTVRVSAISLSHSVLIKVRDTGPGVAPGIRERLFEPFVTAGKEGGLGLGLALSRQAVIEHGGHIWAESCLHGACFAVRLPIIPEKRLISCGGHVFENPADERRAEEGFSEGLTLVESIGDPHD